MADGALGDLFADSAPDLLAGVRRFASGVAAPAIWTGYAAARVPMCLVVADLPAGGRRRAVEYRRAGNALLLDSGAFLYRGRSRPLDWDAVVANYLAIARGPGARISVILPDRVGDQVRSLELAGQFGRRLQPLSADGHEALLPLQRGSLPLPDYCARYVAALGFRPAGFAVPSNASAMPISQLAALKLVPGAPHRVHFLGISRRAAALAQRVFALRAFWPDVEISADACEHRAHVGQKRPITISRRQALARRVDEALDTVDDTEHPAWDAAGVQLQRLFPDADEGTLADLLCSCWGIHPFQEQLHVQLRRQCGPAATADSIEAFARRRFSTNCN